VLDSLKKDCFYQKMDFLHRKNQTTRVGLLLIEGFALLSYSSLIEPMRAANELSGKTLYHIRHIAEFGSRANSSGGVVINANAFVGEAVDFDIIYVVAGGNPVNFNDQRIFRWLQHMANRGVTLAGISGGPIILALAGVMKSRRMTVHWEYADTLAKILPGAMIERTLYVIDRNRITCAGGIAPLELVHALVIENHGAELAQKIDDWFMHTDVRPAGGAQQASITERYGVNNQTIVYTIEAMENHIADPLSLPQLAMLCGVGSRQLNRLFKTHMLHPTMVFYRTMRLAKAYELMKISALKIEQVALATGFSSSSHFTYCFHKQYNHAPSFVRTTGKV